MKNVLILSFMLLLTACASTMPGTDLNLKNSFLKATLKENGDFSNDRIKMYQISIKNYSQDWLTVDSALMSSAPTTQILIGDKAAAWMEACTIEKKVSDYNFNLAMGALAAAGTVAGASLKNSTASTVSYSVALGAIGATGVKNIMESKDKAEFQNALPEGHLFRSFIIPPMKAVQRWVLLDRVSEETPVITLISKDKKISEVSFQLPVMK